VENNPTRIQFRVSVNEDKAEEIITYNKMFEYITKDKESDIQWKFQQIVSHAYKESQCNVLIEWETREITSDPLKMWLQMTQYPVPSMLVKMTYLIIQVGKGLRTLPDE
jgi:hypothetical protein